eukprot:UN00325
MIVRHFDQFNYSSPLTIPHQTQNDDIIYSNVNTASTQLLRTFSKSHGFISQGFPGMIGVVTSVSKTLSQSQKVFLDFGNDDDDGDHAPKLNEIYSKLTTAQRESLDDLSTSMKKIQLQIMSLSQDEIKTLMDNYLVHSKDGLEIIQQYKMKYKSLLPPSPPQQQQKTTTFSDVLLHNIAQYIPQHKSLISYRRGQLDYMLFLGSLYPTSWVSQPSSTTTNNQQQLQGYRPGTYHGVADLWALRFLIEKAQSVHDVMVITSHIARTWPVWMMYGTSNKIE